MQDARAALEADQAERERLIQELTSTQQTLVEESKMLAERLTAARVELGQIQEKQLACQQHVQRLTAQRAELGQQAERLARSAEGLLQRQAQVRQEQEAAQQSEAVLFNDLQTLTAQAQDLSQRAAEAGEAMRTYHADVERYRAIHGEIEQSLHVLEVSLGQSKVRFETLLQRTTDELQLDLPAKYAAFSLPAEDGTPGAGYEPAELDWDEIAVEIKELKEKIQRLGNVNLDSLQEMEELEQRSQFFSQQLTDLSDSKKQLEELIDKINIESGLRFEQTLTAVREHFQGMFRKLFGGGKADIFLETEIEMKPMMGPDGQMLPAQIKKVDPLEAGIEILAHPPGKKPATINQLSGGEKAMTCIALLMSIFKSKPSPFCILDEVDAPLDEANNQRFGMIIQEFLAISQFIVITHHKRTMQICDLLYGVTMQEQGVSKRVAVKFDQVDSQGRISETAAA